MTNQMNLANEILMFETKKSNLQLAQNENGEYNLIGIQESLSNFKVLALKDRELYKAENGNVLDFYIEGNVLVVDENDNVIAIYEGDIDNNRLICNRVLKERE